MDDKLDHEFKELFTAGAGSKYIPDCGNEQTLNIFGHGFTIADLKCVASFVAKLQLSVAEILERSDLPQGSIFIMKIMDNEVQVSFGGLAKK